MQKTIKSIPCLKALINVSVIIGMIFLFLHLTVSAGAKGYKPRSSNHGSIQRDTPVAAMIKSQLLKHRYDLYYPLSVTRFYQDNGFKLAFVAPETVKTQAGEAMMFLDCVIQYGLNSSDFHSKILTYDRLDKLAKLTNNEGIRAKVFFDLMLTDAMITLINNLHYGKLNPYHSTGEIDSGIGPDSATKNMLQYATAQNDFTAAVELAQPKSVAYNNLQRHMHLLTGLNTLDCYDIPDSTIRTMAINMERLRWIQHDSTNYIDINLPAFALNFHTKDSTYKFNITIGDPATPTPVLKSVINYFNSSKNKQDHNTGFVFPLFNFSTPYLSNTKGNGFFGPAGQSFTGGNIKIQRADKLAKLLLINDGSSNTLFELIKNLKTKQVKTFNLKKGKEIVIIYLTCEVSEGILITYNDIYNLDPLLELRLYGVKNQFAQNPRTNK